MKPKPLYIETKINCPLDILWQKTQEPGQHQLWDLRFSEINYLPKPENETNQKFLYATKIGFGIKVSGVGESVATKSKENGESVSVLKFSSSENISIIKEGSGYWKYIPQSDGIKFITGYDYETRWGFAGKFIDLLIFRPLMIWATAWSFDCLKKWTEQDIHPRSSIYNLITTFLINIILAIIWIYQGLVPKLLFTDTGELEILKASGAFPGKEEFILIVIGIAEILFGFIFLFFNNRKLHLINIVSLILLGGGAVFSDPKIFVYPFNPFSLNIAMCGLSLVAIIQLKHLPKASNCKFKPEK